ncbi:hypothetical protein N9355_03720 [Crocinitomicaceae bacterium]|nr:hypothetical protein [Crocinitomicaceae bacterium]
MEKALKVKSEFNSLEKLLQYSTNETPYESSLEYDTWEMRTDANGQMEKCLLVKKSSMHGIKVYFTNADTIKISQVIPSKTKNALLGANPEKRRNIIELITSGIKNAIVKNSQKKAFKEVQTIFDKVAA